MVDLKLCFVSAFNCYTKRCSMASIKMLKKRLAAKGLVLLDPINYFEPAYKFVLLLPIELKQNLLRLQVK